jgi:uncharacterized protein
MMLPETQTRRLLLIVAKVPAAGQTKTRLSGLLGPDGAAHFYDQMLEDTLSIARAAAALLPGLTPGIAFWPPDGEAFFRARAPGFELILQHGANLGERLHHVIDVALSRGYSQAAVLSSDTPFVSPQALVDGFLALDADADIALGPCDDGGYYVMHTRQRVPDLLVPIEMSTPRVLADTLAAAQRAGHRVAMLPETADIDVPDDLTRALAEFPALSPSVAPHTRAWLAAWRAAATHPLEEKPTHD